MALPFVIGHTLSPPAKRPTLVPFQFFQRRGKLLLQLFIRCRRIIQHAFHFVGPLRRPSRYLLEPFVLVLELNVLVLKMLVLLGELAVLQMELFQPPTSRRQFLLALL
jgi:hypothetical protein